MAYMHADTKPKVGFRPYLQTNPRGAAMLSGVHNITGLGQNQPFDPWRLHGVSRQASETMGQWRPFDQDPGGWHLHGLAGLGVDTGGPIDLLTGALWSDEGYAVDGNGNVVVDSNGNPVLSNDLAAALAQAAAAAPGPAAAGGNAGGNMAQSPSGSQLIYAATWSAGLSNLFTSGDGAIGKLQSMLSQYGMSVLPGSKTTSSGPINYAIQVPISDTVGHALLTDAQSVLDSLMQQIVGNLTGSNLNIKSAPGTPVPATAVVPVTSATTSTLTWLEGDWSYLVIGAIAVIFAGPVASTMFKGRRR